MKNVISSLKVSRTLGDNAERTLQCQKIDPVDSCASVYALIAKQTSAADVRTGSQLRALRYIRGGHTAVGLIDADWVH